MTTYQILSPTFSHFQLHALVSFFLHLVIILFTCLPLISQLECNLTRTRALSVLLSVAKFQEQAWHIICSQEIFVKQMNERNGYALLGGF